MLVRGAICLAIALFGPSASAAERPSTFRRVSCTVVRYYVAKYSAAAAESWARSRGATDAEIETARRCLGGSSGVQATQYTGKQAR